jgi:hypothetical protein
VSYERRTQAYTKPVEYKGVMSMPRPVLLQRTLGILVAVALAVCAVVAARRPEVVRVPEPSGAATSAPAAAPAATTPDTAGPSAATTPDTAGPSAASLATAGPGLTEPGIHVLAQTAADGSLEVLERIKLSAPASGLSVALPQATGSGVAGANPSIAGFQAQANGGIVTDMPVSPLPPGGDRLDFPGPATDISMRYRLEGGADRSQPAPVGRVLIVLPPITAADPQLGDLGVVVEVVGGNIRNLVCPKLPVSDQLCGRQNGPVWSTTTIPLSRSLVVAQVDLPQPGQR